MGHYAFEMQSFDALRLCGQGWEPAAPRSIVVLLHGLGEHSERYRHMAEAFNRAGDALITMDLRGHGRSEGRRGHVPNYDAFMTDLLLLIREAMARYPDLPVFIYGHSLGGNLAIHYVLKHRPALAGVIVSAPLLRLAYQPPEWKSALLKLLHALQINLSLSSELERSALSWDFHVVRLYQNDPLVHDRITPPLATGMLRAGEWNLKHAAEFPLPLLLMHGEADRITSVQASIEFAARLEHRCTLKIWDGCYHELHNEPEQEHVFDYVLQWMDTISAKQD